MKLAFASLLAVALAACGARSSMDDCALGSLECGCYPSATCDRGLVCVADTCVQPTPPIPIMGGSMSTGGWPGGGGSSGTGGFSGNGGTVLGGSPSGGAFGSGGFVPSSGGVPTGGVAGAFGLGGSTGGGGTTAAVTFRQGQAQGVMSGWGWVALGRLDTMTSPTCAGMPITASSPCFTTTNWSNNNALCVSGSIPALPAQAVQSDYDNNWGILFAAETTEPPGGGLGSTYRTVTFNFTGSPVVGVRGVVHRKGDAEGTNYCAWVTTGTPVQLTSFNTACWDSSGKALTAYDVPTIDWVGLQVPSTVSAINVANLCLGSIFFN